METCTTEKILDWYDHRGRYFPWRDEDRTPYEILIAEVFLQQTNARSVENIYEDFLQEYDSIEELAEAPEENIKKYLSNLGLQERRTKWLMDLSKTIKNDHAGCIPSKEAELKDLKGIGLYIGNAVLCFGFGEKKHVLDVNTSKVIGRVFSIDYKGDLRRNEKLKKKAKEILPDENIKKFNWALLDIGSLLCEDSFPNCGNCPLNRNCDYYNEKNVMMIPVNDFSFSIANEEGYYSYPAKYNYDVKDYLAFYRTSPVKGITHLARVEQTTEENLEPSGKYRLYNFGDNVSVEPITLKIKELRELATKISNVSGRGVQGVQYTSLRKLDEAKRLSDL